MNPLKTQAKSLSYAEFDRVYFKDSGPLEMIKNTQGSLQEIRFRTRGIRNMVVSNVPDIPLSVIEVIAMTCPNLHTFEGHLEKRSMLYFQMIFNSCALEDLHVSTEPGGKEFFRSRIPFLLPKSLRYLTISIMGKFSPEDFDRFLKSCSAPLINLRIPISPFIDD
ncbi:10376_t:CDS:2, partial [Acaulospora colombiana]